MGGKTREMRLVVLKEKWHEIFNVKRMKLASRVDEEMPSQTMWNRSDKTLLSLSVLFKKREF